MRSLGIFIEARTPTPVILNEIIHLRVGREPEKGLWALLAEPLGCGQVNYSQEYSPRSEGLS